MCHWEKKNIGRRTAMAGGEVVDFLLCLSYKADQLLRHRGERTPTRRVAEGAEACRRLSGSA